MLSASPNVRSGRPLAATSGAVSTEWLETAGDIGLQTTTRYRAQGETGETPVQILVGEVRPNERWLRITALEFSASDTKNAFTVSFERKLTVRAESMP
jgi:hypothetical protein